MQRGLDKYEKERENKWVGKFIKDFSNFQKLMKEIW